MVFRQNLVFGCLSCHAGHRASECTHADRGLYAVKNKGRPRTSSPVRAPKEPAVFILQDGAFDAFYAHIMADEVLRKEYYHAEDPAKKPRKPRNKLPVGQHEKQDISGGGGMAIYDGTCSMEDMVKWMNLCTDAGLEFVSDVMALSPNGWFDVGFEV
jgi:hypothetical protein